MPRKAQLDLPQEVPAQMRATLRRAHDSYLPARLVVLVGAADHTRYSNSHRGLPFCTRSRVHRMVQASRADTLSLGCDQQGRLLP